ncbi:MAG: GNAT family N-acetyltransferase [Armatimonadota bacterium]|nr:GNAT family N-acetyltransferase [Armatimonadota bacterium]MCX7778187.1 GNAT family N-acetyltransferase [Armatimonadota bacterium]MDW8026220.1 GNAT family N-acetyltransferase [Armatimonadota bacterium]
MSSVRVRVLNNFDEFINMAECWNECISSWVPPNRAIFVTSEWLSTWWKQFGHGELFITCVELFGEPLAFAPLFIRRVCALGSNLISFIGTGISDYGEVAIKPGMEQVAVAALMRYLASHRYLWDVIEMRELSLTSRIPSLIKAWCEDEGRQFGIACHLSISEVCPVLKLPSSFEHLLSLVRGNLRSNLKRRERQLRKLFDVQVGVVVNEEQLNEVIEHMFNLHARRWRKRLQPGVFFLPSVQCFHRRFASLALKNGWLAMHFMKLNGTFAAVHYCLRFDSAVCYYGGGFAPEFGKYSIGTVLMGYAIKHAIESKALLFDFLRGCEQYKLLWGAKPTQNATLRLFQKGDARSLATMAMLRLVDRLNFIAKCAAQRIG